MSIHERTLDVIQTFYDAAIDESLWPVALKELAQLTKSQGASFWVLDGSDQPRLPTFICFNFDLKVIDEYLERLAPIDPTVQYLLAHPEEAIVHDGLVITEEQKHKHPYYEWHYRNLDTSYRMVGQTRLMPNLQAGVALHRTSKAGRYEPADISRFGVLHRHLARALEIASRLGSLGAAQQLSTEWLDRNEAAVLFLDERKRLVLANRSAQSLVSSGDGISGGTDGIALSNKQDDDKLQALIAQALSSLVSSGTSSGGTMLARRPSGKRPYGILVSPVSRNYPVLSTFRPAICVVITDPARTDSLPAHKLQSTFGLTEAQAKLAALMAAGQDLRSAADQLAITYGTARTRLAEIFEKTETCRQGELIRLLLATLSTQ